MKLETFPNDTNTDLERQRKFYKSLGSKLTTDQLQEVGTISFFLDFIPPRHALRLEHYRIFMVMGGLRPLDMFLQRNIFVQKSILYACKILKIHGSYLDEPTRIENGEHLQHRQDLPL